MIAFIPPLLALVIDGLQLAWSTHFVPALIARQLKTLALKVGIEGTQIAKANKIFVIFVFLI